MTGAVAGDDDWPWPAPIDDGACDHLKTGAVPVPPISLSATAGGRTDLAGAGMRAVVFVYPFMGGPGRPNPPGWDDIAGAHGSTPQAEGYARLHAAFAELGYEVFGLSGQALADQRECAVRLGLPFDLLNDSDGVFSRALRLPTFSAGEAEYLSRVTLAIAGGRVAYARFPVHPPDRDAEAMICALTGDSGS